MATMLPTAVNASPRAFFFHYNKPASLAAGRPKISVHINGTCHIVDTIEIRVRTESRLRRQQPRFVMTGRGRLHLEINKLFNMLHATITS